MGNDLKWQALPKTETCPAYDSTEVNLVDIGMFMFGPKWLWFFYTAVKCI